jgi:putative aminopeptidase FrvX
MNSLLKELTEAAGVSGSENEIRTTIRDLVEDHVDEWRVDALGNLLAVKKGTGQENLSIMIDAHMDEVGLMITDVDRDGSYRFMPVGGLDERTILGKVVQVGEDKITGVIGLRPIHLLSSTERTAVVKVKTMRVDIGARNKAEASKKAKSGDPVTFLTPYEEHGDIALGKAFDNRCGCAALIEILRAEPYPFDIQAAFTVQEEVGLRGAKVAAFGLKPDAALILETTPAIDLPADQDVSPVVRLGNGPSIYVMDRDTLQDPRFVAHITKTASQEKILHQIRRPGGGGTNSGVIQRALRAIPVATIATPARYTHSPISMVKLNDYKMTTSLAEATLRSLTRDVLY